MPETIFTIDTEVSPAYLQDLLNFLYEHYLLPYSNFFVNVEKNAKEISFKTSGKWEVEVEIKTGKPIQVKMLHSEGVPKEALEELMENLLIAVQLYEEKMRGQTIYFAWVKGEQMHPEAVPSMKKRATDRIFSDSMIFFYIFMISASILLFSFFGYYAALIVIAIQFLALIYADRIMLKLGSWRIDEKNPAIYLLQYQLPRDEYAKFQQKYGMDAILKIKREIYDNTFALGKEPSCEVGAEIFQKYGIECTPERVKTKKIDIFELVRSAAQKFKSPIPKISLANSLIPNATASGISPSRGTILITTGLLVQLEEAEIYGVIGHELAHLIGRDSLILFTLTASEYFLRIYVFLPFFLFSPFIYFMLAMGVIYFIAKFFEARADLESALKIAQPKALASALRKIGFLKLHYERMPSYRIQGWLNWDPHPPLYFRIARLQRLEPREIKNTLIQSVKDVFNGFRGAI
jgi:heat shock protein HtpX